MAMSESSHRERVDVARAVLNTRVFHFFLSAAYVSLIPFLPLFFRLLGLSALQTGILLAGKALTACVIAPLWAKCAGACNKRRGILVFSLMMMMVANMALMLVPPTTPGGELLFCPGNTNQTYQPPPIVIAMAGNDTSQTVPSTPPPARDITNLTSTLPAEKIETSTTKGVNATSTASTTTVPSTKHSTTPSTTPPTSTSTTKQSTTTQPTTTSTTTTTTPTPSTTIKTTTTTTTKAPTTTTKAVVTETNFNDNYGGDYDSSEEQNKDDDKSGTGQPQMIADILAPEDRQLLLDYGFTEEELAQIPAEDLELIITNILQQIEKEEEKKSTSSSHHHHHDQDEARHKRRTKRDIFGTTIKSLRSKFMDISSQMENLEYKTFTLCALIIFLGELFASPTEKIADDMWFAFLDNLDVVEKYHHYIPWATLAMVIMPPIVTSIVDHTSCILIAGMHHFMIHFFMCAVLISVAFLAAFCFPSGKLSTKKLGRRGGLWKGLKIVFSDAHSVTFTMSVFVVGICSAVRFNYLFWSVQDLGGSELVMGVALTVGYASELFMLPLHRFLVKKTSSALCTIIALLVLAGRYVFYSFLWSPWYVLLGEIFHGLSHSLLWGAVQNYQDFRVNPLLMDRSASAVLKAVHYGIGYAAGSILAGFLYSVVGLKSMFQGAAIFLIMWTIVFALVHKCVKRKHKIRYAKLLQAEDEFSAEDSEDDWLETALKENR